MSEVVIIMGSYRDAEYVEEMETVFEELGVKFKRRIASAHKTPEKALGIIREASAENCVFITVAGRSDALSGFTAANTVCPVIASPPLSRRFGGMEIFSSLSMPGAVCPMTVIGAEQAALAAAKILAMNDINIKEKVESYLESAREEVEASDREQL